VPGYLTKPHERSEAGAAERSVDRRIRFIVLRPTHEDGVVGKYPLLLPAFFRHGRAGGVAEPGGVSKAWDESFPAPGRQQELPAEHLFMQRLDEMVHHGPDPYPSEISYSASVRHSAERARTVAGIRRRRIPRPHAGRYFRWA